MVTKWQALKDFLRIQTFIRGAFTVLVSGPLGQRRVEFDSTNLEMQMGYVLAVCPFAYGPDTLPGVDAVIDSHGDVMEMRVLNLEDADRPLERVHGELSYPIVGSHYDDPAPGSVYGGCCNDPGEEVRYRVPEVGVTPGHEIQIYAGLQNRPVLRDLSVSNLDC